jgi:hypothetical protein
MATGAEIPFGWSVRSRRAIDDRFITANLTTRDALSEFRRHKNLEVFVESTNRSYYLDNDTTNSDWMEVLKSIDVLTEDSGITDDDFLVWFDESLKTHKKIKKSDFGGSKWTEVANGIYRGGRVVIGASTVSTNQTFKVTGSGVTALLKSTNSAALIASRVTTARYPASGIASSFSNYSENTTIENGVGVGFTFAATTGTDPITGFTGLSLIGSYLRSAASQQADFVIFTRNGSATLQENLHLRYDGALVIGHGASNPSFGAFLDVRGDIKTSNPTGWTARPFQIGEVTTGTVTPDGRLILSLNGINYAVPTEQL